ncbi:G-box-binding factor 3 isoform X1 [Elaeis guineensis]|uniref:G-box-binding factor 3 isoform X1 n=1 Tax=Elaeis guineensis var. tenera TaxID=51953 RepID=A0A6I9QU49_ELAGV|nr:G-box-binding factor 3 isoform X1 [Elaeis guineensis]
MGNNEAGTPPKSDKASSSVQEKPAIHPYPDWAAMQAYYGPGVMPPPFFSTSVAPGHPPHSYMWGPQPLLPPPFGTPYTAIYPAGGVYSHPPMPFGSHMQCQGIAPSPTISEAVVMATPLSMEMPAKSPSNKDKGPLKKVKGFDGRAVAMGNGTAENRGDDVNGSSKSGGDSVEGSSDGSDGNNAGGNKTQRKRSSEDIGAPGDIKVDTQANAAHGGETSASSKMSLGVTGAPANISGKPIGTGTLSNPTPGMEFRVAATGKVQASGTPISPATSAMMPGRNRGSSELWIQDERELKRERRKQSNRESARRSRLRKQAETEQLAMKVETLGAENVALRSEISRLSENSNKLRLENSTLMEKLKTAQLSQAEESSIANMETEGAPSVVAENFLSMIDNSSSVSRSVQQEDEAHENSSGKLHQLLDSNPRTDAVAAS